VRPTPQRESVLRSPRRIRLESNSGYDGSDTRHSRAECSQEKLLEGPNDERVGLNLTKLAPESKGVVEREVSPDRL
jgi:hypothetical protein